LYFVGFVSNYRAGVFTGGCAPAHPSFLLFCRTHRITTTKRRSYADNLLGCLITTLCVGNTVEAYESGYVITTGLIYACVAAPLAVVFAMLFAKVRGCFT